MSTALQELLQHMYRQQKSYPPRKVDKGEDYMDDARALVNLRRVMMSPSEKRTTPLASHLQTLFSNTDAYPFGVDIGAGEGDPNSQMSEIGGKLDPNIFELGIMGLKHAFQSPMHFKDTYIKKQPHLDIAEDNYQKSANIWNTK